MATFNSDFWEIQTESSYLESFSVEQALWFETEEDCDRRYAMKDFFRKVQPVIMEIVDSKLTIRQREIIKLYFFYGKTQEDIAEILDLTQSTVSRHLFGTVRGDKKVGGAITKLKKIVEKTECPQISQALGKLTRQLGRTA